MPTDSRGLISFNGVFNDIIKNNSCDPLDLTELNSFDRLSVAIFYRISSLGSTLDVDDGKTVNLIKIIENIVNYDYTDIFKVETITSNDISVELVPPSLQYDSVVNNEIIKKIEDSSTTQTILSELFTSEILKYVKSLTIEGTKIDLYTQNYSGKLELIEELPGNFVKQIFKYIEGIKNVENKLSTVDGVKVEISNDLFT